MLRKREIEDFLMCLGENFERKIERNYPKNAPKLPKIAQNCFFFRGVWGSFQWKFDLSTSGGPLVATKSNADISNHGFFPSSTLDACLKAFLSSD